MEQLTFARVEMKYRLTNEQRARLEKRMAKHMVGDEWGNSTIMNVYYDTPAYLLTRRSIEKPYYKEKIRTRRYGTFHQPSDPIFLELKKKSSGVVYKRRATVSPERLEQFMDGTVVPQTQIERELAFTISRYEGLAPAFFVAYDRVAFYGRHDHEFRMTFDTNVRYRRFDLNLDSGDKGTELLDDDTNILEIKIGGAMPLWLVHFLADEKIYRTSYSKVGAAYLRELTKGRIQCASPIAVPSDSDMKVIGIEQGNLVLA